MATVSVYNVLRLTNVEFADGRTDVGEARDYISDCGCRLTFGIRFDNLEKCMLTFPCVRHAPSIAYIQETILQCGDPEHPDYETPTEMLLEKLLV